MADLPEASRWRIQNPSLGDIVHFWEFYWKQPIHEKDQFLIYKQKLDRMVGGSNRKDKWV